MKNKLEISNKDGKVSIDWTIKTGSNTFVPGIPRKEMTFTNRALWENLFGEGLVIQELVKVDPKKTPKRFKHFFYDKNSLKDERWQYSIERRLLNRLKIFTLCSGLSDEELFLDAKHMKEFYMLWKDKSFGDWKVEYSHNQDSFPLTIFFEWEYSNFFIFDREELTSLRDDYSDLFYLATDFSPEYSRSEATNFPVLEDIDYKIYKRRIDEKVDTSEVRQEKVDKSEERQMNLFKKTE